MHKSTIEYITAILTRNLIRAAEEKKTIYSLLENPSRSAEEHRVLTAAAFSAAEGYLKAVDALDEFKQEFL